MDVKPWHESYGDDKVHMPERDFTDFDASSLGTIHRCGVIYPVSPDDTYEIEVIVTPPGRASHRFTGQGASRGDAFSDAIWQAKNWMEARDAN